MSDDLRAKDVYKQLPPRAELGKRTLDRVGGRAWYRPRWGPGRTIFKRIGIPDPWDPSAKDVPLELGEVGVGQRLPVAPHAQPGGAGPRSPLPGGGGSSGSSNPDNPFGHLPPHIASQLGQARRVNPTPTPTPRPTPPPEPARNPDLFGAGPAKPTLAPLPVRPDLADVQAAKSAKRGEAYTASRLAKPPERGASSGLMEPRMPAPSAPSLGGPAGLPARPPAPSAALPVSGGGNASGGLPRPPMPPSAGPARSSRVAMTPVRRTAPISSEPEELALPAPAAASAAALGPTPADLPLPPRSEGGLPGWAGQVRSEPVLQEPKPSAPAPKPINRSPTRGAASSGGGGLDDLFGGGGGETRIRIPKKTDDAAPRRPAVMSAEEAEAKGIKRALPPPKPPPVVRPSSPVSSGPSPFEEEPPE